MLHAHGLVVLAVSDRDRAGRPPPSPSSELVAACRRGDRTALEEVFRAHAADLERLVVRLLGPTADAEDLLQDVFTAAIGAFPRFRGEASVKTWLYRIAVNVAHHHLRAPRLRREVPAIGEPRAEGDSPELSAARRELTHKLYAHLDQLDPRKRVALLLHVVDDLPIAEVAALMGASNAATKSRIFWARRWLLRRMRRDPDLAGGGLR